MRHRKPEKRPVAPAPPKSATKKQSTLKTLDRVLSKAGICSRTEAADWIVRGRVKVNGKPIKDPAHWVSIDHDKISLDGRPLRAEKRLHLLLYKPKGFLTTYKDPDGRPTAFSPEQGRGERPGGGGQGGEGTGGPLRGGHRPGPGRVVRQPGQVSCGKACG